MAQLADNLLNLDVFNHSLTQAQHTNAMKVHLFMHLQYTYLYWGGGTEGKKGKLSHKNGNKKKNALLITSACCALDAGEHIHLVDNKTELMSLSIRITL